MIYDMIYLLTAVGLTPGDSSTVRIYTHKQYIERHNKTEYPEMNMHNNKNSQKTITIHNLRN
jgi:hypothetical protein